MSKVKEQPNCEGCEFFKHTHSNEHCYRYTQETSLCKLRPEPVEQPPAGEPISLERQNEILFEANRNIKACLDRSEASRRNLLLACKKVQQWLDTSSLQQILVHYTEDERRHALIMGLATNLERLEAAIAKEKEVKK